MCNNDSRRILTTILNDAQCRLTSTQAEMKWLNAKMMEYTECIHDEERGTPSSRLTELRQLREDLRIKYQEARIKLSGLRKVIVETEEGLRHCK